MQGCECAWLKESEICADAWQLGAAVLLTLLCTTEYLRWSRDGQHSFNAEVLHEQNGNAQWECKWNELCVQMCNEVLLRSILDYHGSMQMHI